jgi:hypothetical protein
MVCKQVELIIGHSKGELPLTTVRQELELHFLFQSGATATRE